MTVTADTVALNIILAGAFVDDLNDDEKVASSKKIPNSGPE